jgi:DNA-binding response OmpR family regulator
MNNESVALLRGVRVLIVEDHDHTRESLDAHLTLSGALVLTAATAHEALSQVVMCDVVAEACDSALDLIHHFEGLRAGSTDPMG